MSAPSSLAEINRVIKNHNPFSGHFVVKSQQIWFNDMPDFSSHNAHASKVVLDAVRRIKQKRISTLGIALIAPKGTGKTHLLSRVRNQLKSSGDGFFVYMSEYGNLSSIKSHFLHSLVSSLRKPGSQDVMQCQEAVTLLLNQALDKDFSAKELTSKFARVIAQRPELIDQLTSKIFGLDLGAEDPDIIRALIWTLSPVHAPYALNWLAGREITESQSRRLGLPSTSEEENESYAFSTALQVLNLIGNYRIPVICFDELDGAESGDEGNITIGGFTRAMVGASLGKDIYNSLKRGILITAVYPQTWSFQIQKLPSADAVVDRIAEKKVELNSLNQDSIAAFAKCFLDKFYEEHCLNAPSELYPFAEETLKEYGASKPTIREALKWCSENFTSDVAIISPVEKIDHIYQEVKESLEEDLKDMLDANDKIADALSFAFQKLSGQTLEGVEILSIDKEVTPKHKNSGYIQFKIVGVENHSKISIGVGVLQNSNWKGVCAGLRRLIDPVFSLTRGCLVRSKNIPKHWQVANKHLNKLTKELGGEWVSFNHDEIKPLLALKEVYKILSDYDLSQEDFNSFLDQNMELLVENTLILEILSDPSGESPKEVVDEDEEFEKAISQAAESATEEDAELLIAS